MDDARSLKSQIDAINARIDQLIDSRVDCMVIFLAKTITVGTYPTSAASFYAVQMQSVSGNETEGSLASLAGVSGANTKAYNAGPNIPPSGTTVICRQEVSTNRFVFYY